MVKRNLIVAGISTLLVAPAIAFADATTYVDPNIDGTASIELKISDGPDRKVKKVVAKKLEYRSDTFGCELGSGRTGKIVVRGNWRVKDNGEFRVVGQYVDEDNFLNGGQLNVVGDVGAKKVTGDVKFTYGKTGCTTEKVSFTAKK